MAHAIFIGVGDFGVPATGIPEHFWCSGPRALAPVQAPSSGVRWAERVCVRHKRPQMSHE